MQYSQERTYYIHEHPAGATSWKTPEIQELSKYSDAHVVTADLCMFGMTSRDMWGEGLAKKPTKFLTNSPHIAKWLSLKCSQDHRHVSLVGGRAKACEVYPRQLCEAMLQGLKDQLVDDGMQLADGTLLHTGHDEDGEHWDEYTDDISGLPLRSDLVAKAREEEMEVFNQFPVYRKVPLADAWFYTGKGPIGTKWVDVNKGDEKDPEYRSRLVAKEIKRKHDEDIVAATPPLEAKKLLFSLATTGTKGMSKPLKLLFIDVRRAYFYAKSKRPVFVQLPEEDASEGQCGRLEVSMYGTRDAAANWEAEYTNALVEDGFNPGVSTPCAFYNPRRDLRCVVHGDDFTFLGTDEELNWIEKRFKERYEIKVRGRLGPEDKDDKSIRIINRIIEWRQEGIVYEADQRHAEIIIREMGLAEAGATVGTPGVKVKVDEETDKLLTDGRESKYRRLVARANYMAIDRQDIQFAVKELARDMANPKESSWVALTRMAKYLKRRPRCLIKLSYQNATKSINTCVDADWAGEVATRKSTSGGLMQYGSHILKSWSSTQTVIALSSGESEFYSIVKGSSQSLGLQALMKDLNVIGNIKVLTDASTGKAIASRRGLGRVRHIDVSHLWIQEKITNGSMELTKIKNTFNPSDMMTKHLGEAEMSQCMELIDCHFSDGRTPLAPGLNII